jgi:hypothetical protein
MAYIDYTGNIGVKALNGTAAQAVFTASFPSA